MQEHRIALSSTLLLAMFLGSAATFVLLPPQNWQRTVMACNLDSKRIEGVADSAKTRSSLRTLPLVSEFRKLLLQKKEQQEHYRKLCGRSYCTDYLDYICVNEIRERLKPNTLSDTYSFRFFATQTHMDFACSKTRSLPHGFTSLSLIALLWHVRGGIVNQNSHRSYG